MTASLKQLAEDVRRVYHPPAGRPWSLADVAIVKLLKAIEEQPPEASRRRATLEAFFIVVGSDFDNVVLEKLRARIEEACR